jgi:hypothetical protein
MIEADPLLDQDIIVKPGFGKGLESFSQQDTPPQKKQNVTFGTFNVVHSPTNLSVCWPRCDLQFSQVSPCPACHPFIIGSM